MAVKVDMYMYIVGRSRGRRPEIIEPTQSLICVCVYDYHTLIAECEAACDFGKIASLLQIWKGGIVLPIQTRIGLG